MGYSRLLMDHEHVVLESRRHAVVLVRPFAAAALAVAGALIVGYVVTPQSGDDLVDLAVGVIACFFVVRLLWRAAEWRLARIVITDRRLVQITGLVTRKVSSMPLARLTDLTYRRGLLGRLLGYGEIVVASAGSEGGRARLDHLPRSDETYRTIARLVAVLGFPEPQDEGPKWDEADTGPLPRVIV